MPKKQAPDSLVVAALQLNSQADVAENLGVCGELAEGASRHGARVIVLPENFAFFGAEEDKARLAERLGDERAPIQKALRKLSKRTRATIIAGGFPERSEQPDRPYNTCAVFSEEGRLIARYRKIHLFDVDLGGGGRQSSESRTSLDVRYCESKSTRRGKKTAVVKLSGFAVGLSICYDLRFPELYRKLSDDGADVLAVPSAFTLETGKDHWHVLLRARAIECQAWVVAAAQWGRHPEGRVTYGHALIADPWGTVVSECSDGTGYALSALSRERVQNVRQRLPSLRHRRIG